MRIIGGKNRGRPLAAPKGMDTRPTADRVRENLFNILEHGLDGGVELAGRSVVDVFAGTGAFGFEALSRGAAHATFIDNNPAAQQCIRKNAGALGEARNITVLGLDAARLPPPPRMAKAPLAVAFLDPPYQAALADLALPALKGLAARGWLSDGAVCVVEVAAANPFDAPPGFRMEEERTYGAARLIFLKVVL